MAKKKSKRVPADFLSIHYNGPIVLRVKESDGTESDIQLSEDIISEAFGKFINKAMKRLIKEYKKK